MRVKSPGRGTSLEEAAHSGTGQLPQARGHSAQYPLLCRGPHHMAVYAEVNLNEVNLPLSLSVSPATPRVSVAARGSWCHVGRVHHHQKLWDSPGFEDRT